RDYPRRRRVRTNIYTAKDFFNEEIHYRFDILDDDERKELEGTYRLELKGYQGGVWSVKVGENIEIVNRREDTEIVINMQHRDFLSLANGQLNPQLAIFAQKMKIVGDLKKAINFQLLISPTSR
ncbi:MAG: SCP2 sterol-binding domain-containing protein, partial [Proteobacteria bacterium]|nr:SCP2 sterol-binding domain-containing protein [Pseudomonadota bacterium]